LHCSAIAPVLLATKFEQDEGKKSAFKMVNVAPCVCCFKVYRHRKASGTKLDGVGRGRDGTKWGRAGQDEAGRDKTGRDGTGWGETGRGQTTPRASQTRLPHHTAPRAPRRLQTFQVKTGLNQSLA